MVLHADKAIRETIANKVNFFILSSLKNIKNMQKLRAYHKGWP